MRITLVAFVLLGLAAIAAADVDAAKRGFFKDLINKGKDKIDQWRGKGATSAPNGGDQTSPSSLGYEDATTQAPAPSEDAASARLFGSIFDKIKEKGEKLFDKTKSAFNKGKDAISQKIDDFRGKDKTSKPCNGQTTPSSFGYNTDPAPTPAPSSDEPVTEAVTDMVTEASTEAPANEDAAKRGFFSDMKDKAKDTFSKAKDTIKSLFNKNGKDSKPAPAPASDAPVPAEDAAAPAAEDAAARGFSFSDFTSKLNNYASKASDVLSKGNQYASKAADFASKGQLVMSKTVEVISRGQKYLSNGAPAA